jgi:hypothetical protein
MESGVSATDGDGEGRSGQSLPRGVAVALVGGFAALAVASGVLWMRFGTLVFLDAALNLWKTCF